MEADHSPHGPSCLLGARDPPSVPDIFRVEAVKSVSGSRETFLCVGMSKSDSPRPGEDDFFRLQVAGGGQIKDLSGMYCSDGLIEYPFYLTPLGDLVLGGVRGSPWLGQPVGSTRWGGGPEDQVNRLT